MKLALRLALACVVPTIAACSVLPSAGPTSKELVETTKKSNPLDFKIVDVAPAMVPLLATPEPSVAPLKPISGVADKIGVDDVLQITVFETGLDSFSGGAASGSTTASGGSTSTTLPSVTVAEDGSIAIPYIGRVHAAGVTVEDLREFIEDRLTKSKFAAQPQVVVTLTQNLSNTVYVSGDVKNPGRFPLTQSPQHLLDAVTLAGSGVHPPYDTMLTLTRGNQQERMYLGEITPLSPQNVQLESGDRIYVAYEPRTYTVYGATLKPSEIPFQTQHVTLAQALARASGLDDDKADPRGVYLFRFESSEVAKQLGVVGDAPLEPVIYRVNMKDPTSYFVAQHFLIHDHDIIYIADAQATQLRKFLTLLSAVFSPVSTAGSINNIAR